MGVIFGHNGVGRVLGVGGLHIAVVQRQRVLQRAGSAQAAQFDAQLHAFGEVAVQRKHGGGTGGLVVHHAGAQVGDFRVAFGLVAGRVDYRAQHLAVGKAGGLGKRVEDGLAPCRAAGLGHDGADYIHQLRQAGGLDAVGVVHHHDECAAHYQGVFGVVDFFQQAGCFWPAGLAQVVDGACFVPDVPFVKRQHDALGRVLARRYAIGHGHDFLDRLVHLLYAAKKLGRGVAPVFKIGVQRDEVHVVKAMLQHRVFPLAVGGHVVRRRAAGSELDGRVHQAHELGGFVGDAAVFVGGFGADLPGAVHLVAQAPELDVVRCRHAVRFAQVGQSGAAGVVAVLDEFTGFVGAARAQVDGPHGFDVGGLAPFHELVGAELVGFGAGPGQVQAHRAVGRGANTVFPVIARYKVAAGVAHDGGAEFAGQLHHVAAKAACIGRGVAGFIDTGVDRAAQVFDKTAEDAPVKVRDGEVAVDDQAGGDHGVLPVKKRERRGLGPPTRPRGGWTDEWV